MLHIDYRLISIGHPQSNGEAKVTNRIIHQGLKTMLTEAKGLWTYELYSILWAYRTTPQDPTEETPFKLTFGAEAVIHVKIGLSTIRVKHFSEKSNSDRLRADLDLLEEIRERVRVHMATYK